VDDHPLAVDVADAKRADLVKAKTVPYAVIRIARYFVDAMPADRPRCTASRFTREIVPE
jgi:hypothetical protein